MSLFDHARAARIMADCFDNYGRQDENTLLMRLADVYRDAAEIMDDELKADAERTAAGHACTIDHGSLLVPKCPACGAIKGRVVG